LPPTPLIDERLVYGQKADRNRDYADRNGHLDMSILGDTHESRLDKGAWQSQSSTSGLGAERRVCR
jgi:hypothetical protein